jgi:small-conductance mechanosensitive channel
MNPQWPELLFAGAVVFLAAYLVADVAARLVQTALRAAIADPNVEAFFVDRPQRVVRWAIFLITAAALSLPALKFAGYQIEFGRSPDAVAAWLLDSGLRIAIIALAAYFVIRIGSAATRRFEREMSRGTGLDVIERTKRAQTLGRIMHKTLAILMGAVAVLMILRELRVDITPVLTGAGIAGLAIGFGAQTLVRDVISGFFLILEDQVRVGDVAVVNGQGGLVEEVNLRTIVLRDLEGTVHVFPNGEVKTLANKTKDFSYYVIDVGMAYEADPDAIAEAVREAAETLMQDPAFRSNILEPVEVLGVEAFEPSQVVLRTRIKTVPLKQWDVGRELRKRIARIFKERGIQIPLPQMTVRVSDLAELLHALEPSRAQGGHRPGAGKGAQG